MLPGSLRTSKSTFSLQRGSKFLKIALLLFETLPGHSVELQSPPQSSQEHPFGAPGCPKSPPKLSQGFPRASLETFKISKNSASSPRAPQECFWIDFLAVFAQFLIDFASTQGSVQSNLAVPMCMPSCLTCIFVLLWTGVSGRRENRSIDR